MLIASCAPKEQKVMARFVPERSDDFVWENNYVCYRAYGEALEGNPTSPGFDIWVKTPGALVADERYRMELEEGLSYHIDHGNGKLTIYGHLTNAIVVSKENVIFYIFSHYFSSFYHPFYIQKHKKEQNI